MDKDVQRISKQRRWSEAEGQRMVDAWRGSGEARTAFARRYGFAVHRLAYRITTTADPRGAVTERGPVPFHPVRVRPTRIEAGDAAPMEILLLRVPPDALRAVLAALVFDR